ncbi:dipeptide ABC transporter ATP-binding protein [Hephaestia sp. GCM10023244]|uniref:dipeptide ABC transporter ATP-binding protein n=1 Tax=unclassified Hephaestia TaxID=2631281 RepID=UPI002077626A|nr:dipeptide ABC transporter ATP-binding protein [Hephaestia sp. MAHUQ-44]
MTTEAVRGVSFDVAAGRCLAMVGESGSGKSQTCLALLGLLAANGEVSGSARFEGRELVGLREREFNGIRGSKIGVVFQDPLSALAPHLRIGDQIADGLCRHHGMTRSAALAEAKAWLDRVRIPDAARCLRQYPHELSGGMRQRVMIAAALAPRPSLLIADEPTTALDVTIQAELLDLLADLVRAQGTSLIMITHDMGVVARMADDVCVMRDGEIVEAGSSTAILTAPQRRYTQTLLGAISRIDAPSRVVLPPEAGAPVLAVERLSVRYPLARRAFAPRRHHLAVDGVDVVLRAGETLAIVGESGSGKSSLARAVTGLIAAEAESAALLGSPLTLGKRRWDLPVRRDVQIVFQDPQGSLDPAMPIWRSVEEPLRVHHPALTAAARREAVIAALRRVELDPALAERYPSELSGGQAQRVGIARAMILKPRVLVCDEAVSALDVSIRGQIIDLLIALQRDTGLAMLFITHDLSVVRAIAHHVLVLHHGRVMELASADRLFADPGHPYTRSLLGAVLSPDPGASSARPDRYQPTGQGGDLVAVAPDHWVRG